MDRSGDFIEPITIGVIKPKHTNNILCPNFLLRCFFVVWYHLHALNNCRSEKSLNRPLYAFELRLSYN